MFFVAVPIFAPGCDGECLFMCKFQHMPVKQRMEKISMTSLFMDSWWNYFMFALGSQINFVVMHLEFLES